MKLYLNLRFDKHPKKDSPKSLITSYDVKLKAPKHILFELKRILGDQWNVPVLNSLWIGSHIGI
ncbi:unnamed protein product, partial [Adineta steineri]